MASALFKVPVATPVHGGAHKVQTYFKWHGELECALEISSTLANWLCCSVWLRRRHVRLCDVGADDVQLGQDSSFIRTWLDKLNAKGTLALFNCLRYSSVSKMVRAMYWCGLHGHVFGTRPLSFRTP